MPSPNEPADLLIVNGRVFVGADPRRPDRLPPGSRDGPAPDGAPDAVAVAGGRIAWVGRADDGQLWRGPATLVIDAGGGLIAPGFEDAHLHFRMGAISLLQVDLQPAGTIDELARILRAWVASHQDASWVVGRGWHYGTFPGGMPDRRLLDKLVPDRPAVLECFDGHTHWLNSAALSRARVTAETPNPPHGTIERDPATGEPTGILKEFAHELLAGVVPQPSEEEIAAAMGEAIVLAQRHGLTAVHEAWTEIEDLRRYVRLRDEARLDHDAPLGLRFRVAFPADAADWREGVEPGRRAWEERLASYSGELAAARPDEWLSGGIVKAFADGVIESRTAWMLDPYEEEAGMAEEPYGRPNWTSEALAEMTSVAAERGWQVQIHAIGDAAIRAALDAHEQAAVVRTRGLRHHPRGRIEHVEWPHPDDVPRFGAIGAIASMQPYHASPVPHKARVRERQIGTRTERGWPWASILRAGGVVAFGSDWPVASFDPLVHLHAAVTRTDRDGHPEGGWLPRERLAVAEALACYTWGSAFAALGDARRGTIAPGRAADLVVLDRDILAEGAAAIAGTRVLATISGGDVVYRAG